MTPALLVVVPLLVLAACGEPHGPTSPARPTARPGLRITMAALHDAGGVPPGWRFTPPPGDPEAGRRTFLEVGCDSCHVVRADGVAAPDEAGRKGPELTTMGSHHPPAYFLESITNPDAVLVDGPGYVGADGRSTMPAYPDLTVGQLADVVAYLQTLTGPRDPTARPLTPAALGERPAPPPGASGTFLVQTYDVKPGRLAAFEAWFRDQGRAAFLAQEGLLSVETYVDNTRPGPGLITMLRFADDAALARFTADPAGIALAMKVDEFSGPHGHQTFRTRPVYRADSLSTP